MLAFSISINPARQGRLVDEAGRPIAGAFVFYHYSAGTKLIWPWAYQDGPYFTRTDRNGRFRIPHKVRLRFPLAGLASPVRAYLGIYAPHLHNACELDTGLPKTDTYCAKAVDGALKVYDLGSRPTARFRTLWLLLYVPRALAQGPVDQRRELIAAAREEYNQFLGEYGDKIFDNLPGDWGHIAVSDWTQENGEHRPWRFFLHSVPFYGVTMEQKLAQFEKQRK